MSFYCTENNPLLSLKKFLSIMPDKIYFQPSILWHITVDQNWGGNISSDVDDYRFTFVRGGRGRYWINDYEISLERGRVIFLSPGNRLRMVQTPGKPPHLVTGRFDLFYRGGKKLLIPPINSFGIAFLASNIFRMEQLFVNLAEDYEKRNDPLYKNSIESCIHTILTNVFRETEIHLSGGYDSRIEDARQYLRDHPLGNIDWNKLARKNNLSRDYFSKMFTRDTGLSPKSYHLRIKMEYAHFLLNSSALSIQEVADLLGYADAFIFSRQFKRSFGVSPSQVRK
jgi:AraC-like DNA-binding protein